jgi:hypothetical protein
MTWWLSAGQSGRRGFRAGGGSSQSWSVVVGWSSEGVSLWRDLGSWGARCLSARKSGWPPRGSARRGAARVALLLASDVRALGDELERVCVLVGGRWEGERNKKGGTKSWQDLDQRLSMLLSTSGQWSGWMHACWLWRCMRWSGQGGSLVVFEFLFEKLDIGIETNDQNDHVYICSKYWFTKTLMRL